MPRQTCRRNRKVERIGEYLNTRGQENFVDVPAELNAALTDGHWARLAASGMAAGRLFLENPAAPSAFHLPLFLPPARPRSRSRFLPVRGSMASGSNVVFQPRRPQIVRQPIRARGARHTNFSAGEEPVVAASRDYIVGLHHTIGKGTQSPSRRRLLATYPPVS